MTLTINHRCIRSHISDRFICCNKENRFYRVNKEKQITNNQFLFLGKLVRFVVYNTKLKNAFGDTSSLEENISNDEKHRVRQNKKNKY